MNRGMFPILRILVDRYEINVNKFQFSDPFEIIDLKPNETVENSQTNFIFVGVMTAKNFLEGRANAVYHTWGKEVPGKIAFFSSEKSYSEGRYSFSAWLTISN